MIEGILQAAELIHAAALAPDAWQAALAAVGELLGGDQVTLLALGANGGADGVFAAAAGLDERDLRLASSPEAMRLAAPLVAMMPPGVAIAQELALMSEETWSRSAYYNECIRPLGAFHGIGFRHLSAGGSLALFSICRPRNAGSYDAQAIAATQMLLPHFCTALELQQRLHIAEGRHAGLAQLLDRLDAGVIATDACARPLHVNAHAAAIAAQADGLALTESGLYAATPAATRELARSVAAVAAGAAARRLWLGRPSGRPPLLLTLLPIGARDVCLPGLPSPRAAIFVAEPDAPPAIDRAALADIYRLTRRESDIAALLADGLGLDAIAARLGIGVGTARNHLKRVFDKTGTSSQAALVASLRGLTQWMR